MTETFRTMTDATLGDEVEADTAPSGDLQPIWGARAIAREIGISTRRAHYLLAGGELKGARKIGGIWTITRRKLRECFEGVQEAA